MSVRTVALMLAPTTEEAAALERLQRQFNDACTYIAEVAWQQQEFNSVRLHRLVYYEVRARFGLLAQHAVRAIAVVADSYRTARQTQHIFRPDAAVVLDTPRLYRLTHNRASIATLDGRLGIALNIGGNQRARLAAATKIAEADLVRDHKGRWRLLVCLHVADPAPIDPHGVLGVDLGRRYIAVTSDGETFSGAQVAAVRDRYATLRAKLQQKASKGTRSSRRRCRQFLQRLAGREHRFQRHTNHVVSKTIVARAVETGRGIALEDLSGIRQRTNEQQRPKVERRRSNSWAFYQLRQHIAYKCVSAGLPLVLVNPAYTSQMCHQCLHLGQRDGKAFACPNCGWSGDADVNGAKNIALLGLSVMQSGGPGLACQLQGF